MLNNKRVATTFDTYLTVLDENKKTYQYTHSHTRR